MHFFVVLKLQYLHNTNTNEFQAVKEKAKYLMKRNVLQSRKSVYIGLLNMPYEIEVILKEKNLYLICCQPLELLIYFEKEFGSFHTGNVGSVNQRAAELLAIWTSQETLPLRQLH